LPWSSSSASSLFHKEQGGIQALRRPAEIETLSEHTYIWSDRQKGRAGAIVSVTHDGKLAVMRGLIRPEDMKPAKPDEESPPVRRSPSEGGCFSAALADDLTAHRTAALRAMLADRPTVALAAVTHALAQTVFYTSEDSGFAIRAISPALRAEGIEGSAAAKSLADQHAAWQGRLPNDEAALWDWLLSQDGGIVTGLLAYCAACAVKPERDPRADQLAAAVALDMAQWWQPTVTGYLGRVSKTLILEAVTEAKGKAAADNLAALKKGDMADRAAELLSGTGWLPAMLRVA
jgi:ParB family chromosome partitioning protein